MGSLLGSLGVIAKFEAGPLMDGTIDLTDLTSRVAERHRALAARLRASLECAVPAVPVLARGDLTFAEQAVANLVGNALGHNQGIGEGVVRGGFARHEGHH
jgi:signal transduction histidine kinase